MTESSVPEPTTRDEELALELLGTIDDTGLRGDPGGNERCNTCHFLADPDRDIAFCWHRDLRILVGGAWRCDNWVPAGTVDARMRPEDVEAAAQLWSEKVAANGWVVDPPQDRECSRCLHDLDHEASVSYCWHPDLRVAVGSDHGCRWWDPDPGDV